MSDLSTHHRGSSVVLLSFLVFLAAVAGCGDDDPAGPPVPGSPLAAPTPSTSIGVKRKRSTPRTVRPATTSATSCSDSPAWESVKSTYWGTTSTAVVAHRSVSMRSPSRRIAALFLLIAVGHWLGRYELLFSPTGTVFGVGWTDAHINLPGRTIMAVVAAVVLAKHYGLDRGFEHYDDEVSPSRAASCSMSVSTSPDNKPMSTRPAVIVRTAPA